MWKVHPEEKDVKYITINETIALDSNYSKEGNYVLTRSLKNIESLYLKTLVIPNFSIDIMDIHYETKNTSFIVGGKQMVAPQTLLDLKYILVCVDYISGNQIGANSSNISQCSGLFIMDTLYSRSTNNAMTGKNSVQIDVNSTSPDNIVLILRNTSSKKRFIPTLGSLSHLNVKLMLPDGRELKRRHDTLSIATKPIGQNEIQSITCANDDPAITGGGLIFTFITVLNSLVVKHQVMKLTRVSGAVEHRLITDVTNLVVTINSAFTTNPVIGDTIEIKPMQSLFIDPSANKIIIKTNDYFSALEYRIGDVIKISGSEIPFLDRERGHIITNLTNDNGNTSNIYNQLYINSEYSFSQNDLNLTNELFNKIYDDVQSGIANKTSTIKNLNNNYLLTIDSNIKIQDI